MASRRLPISAFLRKSEDWVQPEPDQIYQQIRVRLWGKGLTLRAKVLGAKIAARRQLRASAGQFLISRIDARHGAFGIVPDQLDGALVSNDFPCFDIDERVVLPRYLEWYTRADEFVQLCRLVSEGSTNRVRLKEDRFIATQIPIPPLDVQQWTVERLDKIASLLARRRRLIDQLQRDMRAMTANALQRIITGADYRPLGDVAPLVRRQVDIAPDHEYTEIGVRSFYNGIFHRRTMTGSEYSWQKLFRIREGDLVFSNLMAWEKAIAVASAGDDGCVGNHRMLTCEVDRSQATPSFLLEYFKTQQGFADIVGQSPGSIARNKTLSSKSLALINIPVPPIDRQYSFDIMLRKSLQCDALSSTIELDIEALTSAIIHRVYRASC